MCDRRHVREGFRRGCVPVCFRVAPGLRHRRRRRVQRATGLRPPFVEQSKHATQFGRHRHHLIAGAQPAAHLAFSIITAEDPCQSVDLRERGSLGFDRLLRRSAEHL